MAFFPTISDMERYHAFRRGDFELDLNCPLNHRLVGCWYPGYSIGTYSGGDGDYQVHNLAARGVNHATDAAYQAGQTVKVATDNVKLPGWSMDVQDTGYGYLVVDDSGSSSRLDFTGDFTFAAWAKATATLSTWDGFFSKTDSAWTTGWGFYWSTSELMIAWAGDYNSNNRTYAVSVAEIQEWHFYVGTVRGSNLHFYVDGNDGGSVAKGTTSISDPVRIGVMGDPASYKGNWDVAECKIWDRALTAEEVKYLYNRPWAHVMPTSYVYNIAGVVLTPPDSATDTGCALMMGCGT